MSLHLLGDLAACTLVGLSVLVCVVVETRRFCRTESEPNPFWNDNTKDWWQP